MQLVELIPIARFIAGWVAWARTSPWRIQLPYWSHLESSAASAQHIQTQLDAVCECPRSLEPSRWAAKINTSRITDDVTAFAEGRLAQTITFSIEGCVG